MIAALAYGVGIRYVDKTGQPYEIECEIERGQIKCYAPCTGEEERCIVYKTLTIVAIQLRQKIPTSTLTVYVVYFLITLSFFSSFLFS